MIDDDDDDEAAPIGKMTPYGSGEIVIYSHHPMCIKLTANSGVGVDKKRAGGRVAEVGCQLGIGYTASTPEIFFELLGLKWRVLCVFIAKTILVTRNRDQGPVGLIVNRSFRVRSVDKRLSQPLGG